MRKTPCKLPKILCVEDHPEYGPTMRKRVETMLSVRADLASDGGMAVGLLCAAKKKRDFYDLVILDMYVPREPLASDIEDTPFGLDFLRVLRTYKRLLRPHTPIIVYTSHPEVPHCIAAGEAGACDYIPKLDSEGRDNFKRLVARCRQLLFPGEPARRRPCTL